MQLPQASAAYGRRVEFGRYVTRTLRRGKFADLAEAMQGVTDALLVQGRAWEDARALGYAGQADRDAVDAELDVLAQTIRLSLASRDLEATQRAPYTAIFPRGIAYYTAAPLSAEVARYLELAARLDKHLDADDPLRAQIAGIEAGVADFKAADDALATGRRAQALARTDVAVAQDAFDAEVGRSRARRFFPRAARGRGAADDGVDESAPADT